VDAGTALAKVVIGSPFVAKTNANSSTSTSSVVAHPSNHFVYVANQDINNISRFRINSTTGALTEVLPRTPLIASGATGLSPAFMTMDKEGKFLFVSNQITNDVWVFSIASSGALSFVSRALLAGPPSGIALSPEGNLLYVPVQVVSAIYAFSVNSGVLTQAGPPFAVSGGVGIPAVDSNGNFLLVPNPSDNTITVLRIQADGSLALGPGAFATGTTPVAAAISPTGNFLYVANSGSSNISQFLLTSSTGVLTPLTTATVPTGTEPSQIVNDPDGTFIFVVNQTANTVAEFTINSAGNSAGTLVSTGNQLQLTSVPRSFSITK